MYMVISGRKQQRWNIRKVQETFLPMAESTSTDRYVSCKGIDCLGSAKRFMTMLCSHLNDPSKNNKFWEFF